MFAPTASQGDQSDLKVVLLNAREAWALCVVGRQSGDPDQKFREMIEADRACRRARDRRNEANRRLTLSIAI
jgi:hypothetical protein